MFASLRQLHWSVYALAFASGVIMTGFMMLIPLLPAYSEELGFNEYEIGLLVAAFFIGRVLLQFPLGILSDHIGRRHIIWAALLLFAFATTAYALTETVSVMIALRTLQGVASSAFVVGAQSYINDRTPSRSRGLANGVMSSAINIGVIAGPVLGGALSVAYNIRAPFWVGGALGLVCFFVTLSIPHLRHPHGPSAPWADIRPQASRLRGVLSTVLCLPALSLSTVHFLFMAGLGIFLTSVPVLTAILLSWSANLIALALALNGAVAAFSSPYLGRLSDRVGRVKMMIFGLVVMGAQGLVVFLHPGTPITLAALTLGGVAAPAYFNSFYSLQGDLTRPRERGALMGFVGSFGEWGSIIGSSLITPLVWRSVNVNAPMAVNAGILAFTVVVVLLLRATLKRQVGRPTIQKS
ncbi:MAG: MFS transporter [Thermoleophilia bacterium]|nr:MFS transporter [Thermoleophilia bacterium]